MSYYFLYFFLFYIRSTDLKTLLSCNIRVIDLFFIFIHTFSCGVSENYRIACVLLLKFIFNAFDNRIYYIFVFIFNLSTGVLEILEVFITVLIVLPKKRIC